MHCNVLWGTKSRATACIVNIKYRFGDICPHGNDFTARLKYSFLSYFLIAWLGLNIALVYQPVLSLHQRRIVLPCGGLFSYICIIRHLQFHSPPPSPAVHRRPSCSTNITTPGISPCYLCYDWSSPHHWNGGDKFTPITYSESLF